MESNERRRCTELETIINASQDAIVAYNCDFTLRYFNKSYLNLCVSDGFFPELGKNVKDIFNSTLFEKTKPYWERVFAGETIEDSEFYLPDGNIADDYIKTYYPIYDDKGAVSGGLLFMRRVTELNRVQRERQRRQREIEALLNASQDYVIALTLEYQPIYLNTAVRKYLGKHGITPGTPFWDLVSADQAPIIRSLWERAFKGEKFSTEIEFTFPENGETRNYNFSLSPIKDEKNTIIGAVVYARDITDFLAAKQQVIVRNAELRARVFELNETKAETERQRAELEAFFNATHDMVIAIDKDYKVVYLNESHKQYMRARGKPQYIGMPYRAMIEPHEWENVIQYWKLVFQGKSFCTEISYQFENEPVRYYESTFSPVLNEYGEVVRGVLFIKEVTTLKLAQQATQKHRAELETIINATQDCIVAVNTNWEILYFNKAYENIKNKTNFRVYVGMRVDIDFPKDLFEQIKPLWERVFRGDSFTTDYFYTADKPRSEQHITTYTPLKSPDGEVFGGVLVMREITEVEIARRALTHERNRLLGIANSLNGMISLFDHDFKLQFFNQDFYDYFKKSGIEVYTGLYYPDLLPKDDPTIYNAIAAALRGENIYYEEPCPIYGESGGYFAESYRPYRDEHGNIIGAVNFCYSIEQRVKVERELQAKNYELQVANRELAQAQEVIRGIIENFKGQISVLNTDYQIIYYNQKFLDSVQATGFEPRTGISMGECCLPEVWQYFRPLWDRALAGESFTHEVDYPNQTKDGYKVHSLLLNFYPLYDLNGNIYLAVLYVQNVTPIKDIQRQLEQRNRLLENQRLVLQQHLENLANAQTETQAARELALHQRDELHSIIENLGGALCAIDNSYNLILFNQLFFTILSRNGFTVETGMRIQDCFSRKDWIKVKAYWARALSGETFTEEMEYRFQNEYFNLLLNFAPLKRRNGYIFGAVIFAQNISTLKKAQQEIQQKNEELESQSEELRQNLEELAATQEQMRLHQQVIERQRNQIHTIINASQDYVIALDTEYNLLFFNDTFANLMAKNGLAVTLNMDYRLLVNPMVWNEHEKYWQRAFRGESFNTEVSYQFEPNGLTHYYHLTFSPLIDESPQPPHRQLGAIGFSRDISINKRYQLDIQHKNEELESQSEELRANLDQVEKLNKSLTRTQGYLQQTLDKLRSTQSQLVHAEKMSSLGQLTAGIAHEINNPINFVHGGIDALKDNINVLLQVADAYTALDHFQDPAQLKARLQTIENLKQTVSYDRIREKLPKVIETIKVGASRTAEIVLSLRNFSRLDEAERKPVDIHEGIDSTLMLLNSKIKNRIQIIKNYDPKLNLVNCYPSQLNQVFMNIISNAIQAIASFEGKDNTPPPPTPPDTNGYIGKIFIITHKTEKEVRIIIQDTGPGIPYELLDKIFDPFFTTKEVGKGTGLGLSISFSIIERHGGTVHVSSEPNQGACFTITIPL